MYPRYGEVNTYHISVLDELFGNKSTQAKA
jgi:hypothetical protein